MNIQPCRTIFKKILKCTRMHSSRDAYRPLQWPSLLNAPTMNAPCHGCPLAIHPTPHMPPLPNMPPLPHMPPLATYAPHCHTCPPTMHPHHACSRAMHTPLPSAPPAMHSPHACPLPHAPATHPPVNIMTDRQV